MRRGHRVLATTALGAALGLQLGWARAQSSDEWFGADKALHFAASAAIGGGGYAIGAACFDATWPRVMLGSSLALAAGVGKELFDLAGHGDPSWRDLAWDALGTGVGVTVAWLIDRATRADPPRRRAQWTLVPTPRGGALTVTW